MADQRLNSFHLGMDPRRREYRRAREVLLGERGWLTLAGEHARGFVAEADDWPSLLPLRPEHVLAGTPYVLIDHQAGCTHPLRTGLNTIGRMPDNDIVFEEIWVSRRHCVILVHARGGCELHDTASRNGTFVNGERVRRPVHLTSGDRIKVCERRLLLLREEDYRAGFQDDGHPSTAVL